MENAEIKNVGDMIRVAREAQRLTRREVADALKMNDQHLYQIETGRRNPSLETIWTLATHLGLDPHTLDPRLSSTKPTDK